MPAEQQPTEAEQVRRECITKIDTESHNKEINVNNLVIFYQEKYREEPILRLVQDINQRVGIYSNIIEDIKRISEASTELMWTRPFSG